MLKIALAAIAVLIAAVLLYAATKPDTFRVQRTTTIKAAPEKIFPHIDDLGRFSVWSPYEKKDAAMKKTRSGPSAGVGAAMAWDGDKNVGAGRLTIVESNPPSKVTLKLDMLRPVAAHNIIEFALQPRGETTEVTWAMHGDTPYFVKVIHLFLDVDRMVGNDFEAGLANLKAIAERQ